MNACWIELFCLLVSESFWQNQLALLNTSIFLPGCFILETENQKYVEQFWDMVQMTLTSDHAQGFQYALAKKTWLEHVHGHVGFQMSVCLELMLVSFQSNGVTL